MKSYRLKGWMCALAAFVGTSAAARAQSTGTSDDAFTTLEEARAVVEDTESRVTSTGKQVDREARNVASIGREFQRTGNAESASSELDKAFDRMTVAGQQIESADTTLANLEAELTALAKQMDRQGDKEFVTQALILLDKIDDIQRVLTDVSNRLAKVLAAIAKLQQEIALVGVATNG